MEIFSRCLHFYRHWSSSVALCYISCYSYCQAMDGELDPLHSSATTSYNRRRKGYKAKGRKKKRRMKSLLFN